MGAFDQAARHAATAEPGFVHGKMGALTGLSLTWRRWFNTRAVPLPNGPEREADLVSVADEPGAEQPAWLLIYEFQSRHDEDKPKILQLEAMTFLVYGKDTDRGGAGFRPLPVFVYLVGKCPGGSVSYRTPTGRGFSGDPVIWEVAGDSATEHLAMVGSGERPWGAMFWVALMDGADSDEVIDLWVRLREEKVPPRRQSEVTVIALVFAELAGRRRAWDRVKQGVDMTESAVLNELIELREVKVARAYLIEAIKGRFPEALTPAVERTIAEQPSLDLMTTWHSAVVRAQTAQEVLDVLRRWTLSQGADMTESAVLNELLEPRLVKVAREHLLQVVKARFPEALTPEVERAIVEQPSLDLMEAWFSAAARAKTGQEFLDILRR